MKRTAAILLAFFALSAFAAGTRVPPPPNGMGVYLVVLRDPSMHAPGASVQKLVEPDFAALGGTLLQSQNGRRLLQLPIDAAEKLRHDPNIAYVQRVWMGEPLDAWRKPAGPRLQANSAITTNAAPVAEWTTGEYAYDDAGDIKSTGTDAFGYDSAQRVISASLGTDTETYRFDSFGNLLQNGPRPALTVNADNQVVGRAYDAVGDMLDSPTGQQYHYDALGMIVGVETGGEDRRMIYTADNERIAVAEGTSLTRYRIRDFAGHVLREWSTGPDVLIWDRDYIYADGQLVAGAVQASGDGMRHYHLDHLGSTRLVTDGTALVVARQQYWPFGEEKSSTTQEFANTAHAPRDPLKFTGHERDYDSDANVEDAGALDYMHARYYRGGMGRFLSVDPVLQVNRALHAPQMWNRYTYALDNPLAYTDPTGSTVYIVTYMVGNTAGDDQFQRAAMTRAAQIRGMKSFDPKKDKVILSGVRNKSSFAKTLETAKSLEPTYGKVGELSMFSHAGPADGPVFHQGVAPLEQFSKADLKSMSVNWEWWGSARFFGCSTAQYFTQYFADAQGVTAYGFEDFAGFSGSPVSFSPPFGSGPLYMVQPRSNHVRGGFWGAAAKWSGFDRGVVPMVPADPSQ